MEKYNAEYCQHQHDTLEHRLSQLEKTVRGNGQEGLSTKVAKLEADMPQLKADMRITMRAIYIAFGISTILQPLLMAFLLKHLVGK